MHEPGFPSVAILPAPRLLLYYELAQAPPELVLYGGTALALHLVPMTPIPLDAETRAIAAQLVWFEPPEQALADPVRFVAYAFARASHAQMKVLRRLLSDGDLRQALDRAPPGIIDPRSWAYWNAHLGRHPAPPMPVRHVG